MLSVEDIARVAHEVNRAYCESFGDTSQLPWEAAPERQQASVRAGVALLLAHPETPPGEAHAAWMAHQLEAGWRYGPVKNPQTKEHPSLLAFDLLPREQRTKDYLFCAVVRALATATAP